jgi:hypothetical protein
MSENVEFPPEITKQRIDEIQLNKRDEDKEELLLGIVGECAKYARMIWNSKDAMSIAVGETVRMVRLWDWKHDNILANIKANIASLIRRELAKLKVVHIGEDVFIEKKMKPLIVDSYSNYEMLKKIDNKCYDSEIVNILTIEDILAKCSSIEKKVILLLLQGETISSIAEELNVSYGTIRECVKRITKRCKDDSDGICPCKE